MDPQFMEFWGSFLLNAAKSQKQVEDLVKWIKNGFTGFEDLTALFQKVYGLEKVEKESPDQTKLWAGAQENFIRSFKDCLAMLGVVPMDEHLALVEKYEALKKKTLSQKETISHLRMLLSRTGRDEFKNLSGQFEELAKRQGEQFQKLMEGFTRSSKKADSSED
jgi:hypothetical protein